MFKKVPINHQPNQSEALYISSPSNIHYLTGFKGSFGLALYTSKKIHLFTDSRYLNEIKNKTRAPETIKQKIETIEYDHDFKKNFALLLKKENIKTLYFEENHLKIAELKYLRKLIKNHDIILKSSKNIIEEIRTIKTENEINKILNAQKITEKTFEEIKKHFKNSITEKEIAWKIEKIGRDFGADNISFPPIVAFGKNSGTPHHEPDNTKLKKGDLILLDFGFKFKGYCSDMTRMLFTKTPTPLEEQIYTIVLTAQQEGINKIKPGIKGSKADYQIRQIIKKTGFEENFTHSSGHGVGIDIHELPNLSPLAKKKPNITLKENMVITIEPGIYLEKKFGIRIEDMIIIGKKSNQNLTKTPKKIKELIIK